MPCVFFTVFFYFSQLKTLPFLGCHGSRDLHDGYSQEALQRERERDELGERTPEPRFQP